MTICRRRALIVALLVLVACSDAHPLDPRRDCGPDCTSPACASDVDCADEYRCADSGHCVPATCGADADCSEGTVCDVAAARCVPGGGCDHAELGTELVKPNLLLVLDRSCSMRGNAGGAQKWPAAVAAIDELATGFADRFRFGLILFPDTTGDKCAQDAPAVAVSDDGAAAVASLLEGALEPLSPLYPDGPCVTNIDSALASAKSDPAMSEPRPTSVLLLTDGQQSDCALDGGSAGAIAITEQLAAAGVRTFVVGFGDKSDLTELDALAVAGGAPNSSGGDKFYGAADPSALEEALATIASKVVSCTYALDQKPSDADGMYVFLDDVATTRDPSHGSGWDYDAKTGELTFYGSACASLQSGAATNIDVVVGCPAPVPN